MPEDFWLNMVDEVAILWSTTPTFALYLYVFLFAAMISIAIAVKFEKPFAGLITFLGVLLAFSILGAFPVWIIILPLVIVLAVIYYSRGNNYD